MVIIPQFYLLRRLKDDGVHHKEFVGDSYESKLLSLLFSLEEIGYVKKSSDGKSYFPSNRTDSIEYISNYLQKDFENFNVNNAASAF